MKWFLFAFVSTSLAFPAGDVIQLCRHQSGSVHIFADDYCDGNRSHGHRGMLPHHDHGHEHPDEHSEHSAPGEHHEPCSHETVSSRAELATVKVPPALIPDLVTTVLAVDLWWCSIELPTAVYLQSEPRVRGPPGLDDPLGQFTSCIRLTV